MAASDTIATIFAVGILAYFGYKVILPGLKNMPNIQMPQLQFPQPNNAMAQPFQQQTPAAPVATTGAGKTAPIVPNSHATSPNVPGTAFTFNVVGDIDYFEGTGQNLCGGNPTLALIIGDFSYDCNAQKWWTTTMRACNGKNVLGSVGNHDCQGKGFIDLFPANGGKWEFIKKVGSIAFIAVNTGFCSAQCMDLKSEALFQQAQADPSVKFIIAHFHKPVFTTGTAPDAPISLHNMMKKYSKVKMAFAGHNHSYRRYVPQDGIQYITAGAGGHDKTSSTPVTKGPSSGSVGVVKCRVAQNGSITCQYVANSGEILDSWGLTADGKHTGSGGVTPKQGTAPSESAAYAQALYSSSDFVYGDNPDKETRDNEFLSMMDRYNTIVHPQRKFNNVVYHYSNSVQ